MQVLIQTDFAQEITEHRIEFCCMGVKDTCDRCKALGIFVRHLRDKCWKHHGERLTMRHVGQTTDDFRKRVRCCGTGIGERASCKGICKGELGAVFQIAWVFQGFGQILHNEFHRAQGVHLTIGRGMYIDVALKCVGESVKTRHCCHACRQGEHERWIDNADLGEQRWVIKGQLFITTGDDSGLCDLRAGAGGGGNRHKRKHGIGICRIILVWRRVGLEQEVPVDFFLTVGEGNGFCGINTASAAHRKNEIDWILL